MQKRQIVIAKELTKIHETYYKGTVQELIQTIQQPKGEYVIIIQGETKTKQEKAKEKLNNLSLEEHYKYYEQQGLDKKEIIKKISKDRQVNKNEIYKKFINK